MMIPPLANQIIMNIKGTSLAVTITVPELMFVAYTGASNTFRAGDFYLIAAIFYLALIIPLGQISKRLEGSRLTRSAKLLSTTTTSNKTRRIKVP
jgi:ABC-type amino acid transport system permease subunit